ncbi:hypothetical protein WKY82_16000 [Gordonia malaquae]
MIHDTRIVHPCDMDTSFALATPILTQFERHQLRCGGDSGTIIGETGTV